MPGCACWWGGPGVPNLPSRRSWRRCTSTSLFPPTASSRSRRSPPSGRSTGWTIRSRSTGPRASRTSWPCSRQAPLCVSVPPFRRAWCSSAASPSTAIASFGGTSSLPARRESRRRPSCGKSSRWAAYPARRSGFPCPSNGSCSVPDIARPVRGVLSATPHLRRRIRDASPGRMRIVLIENFRSVFYAPFYAACTLGAYEAEGLEVEVKPATEVGWALHAVATGAGHVSWGGPLRVLTALDLDPKSGYVAFCEVVGRDPFFLVGRRPNPGFKPTQLPEWRFAPVTEVPTPWICLQHDLRRAGIAPSIVKLAAGRTMAENAAALRAGEVDVIQVFQPYAEALV